VLAPPEANRIAPIDRRELLSTAIHFLQPGRDDMSDIILFGI
jgi:hypothetical protein